MTATATLTASRRTNRTANRRTANRRTANRRTANRRTVRRRTVRRRLLRWLDLLREKQTIAERMMELEDELTEQIGLDRPADDRDDSYSLLDALLDLNDLPADEDAWLASIAAATGHEL